MIESSTKSLVPQIPSGVLSDHYFHLVPCTTRIEHNDFEQSRCSNRKTVSTSNSLWNADRITNTSSSRSNARLRSFHPPTTSPNLRPTTPISPSPLHLSIDMTLTHFHGPTPTQGPPKASSCSSHHPVPRNRRLPEGFAVSHGPGARPILHASRPTTMKLVPVLEHPAWSPVDFTEKQIPTRKDCRDVMTHAANNGHRRVHICQATMVAKASICKQSKGRKRPRFHSCFWINW